jgi:hypothetical protein
MNKTKNSLIKLIKSLENYELQEIRQTLRKTREKSLKIELFEYIEAQEEPKEKDIITKLKLKPNIYAVLKNQLYIQILEIIRNIKEVRSITYQIHLLLDEIEILYSKGLEKEALITSLNVHDKALMHNLPVYALVANKWRTFLTPTLTTTNIKNEMAKISTDNDLIIQNIKHTSEIHSLYISVISHLMQNLSPRSKDFNDTIKNFTKNPLLNLNENELLFYPRSYLYMTKSLLYIMQGDFQNAYVEEKKVWDSLHTNWDFYFKHKNQECINSIINYMNVSYLARKFDQLRSLIKWVETTISISNSLAEGILFYKIALEYFENTELTNSEIEEFIENYKCLFPYKNIEIFRQTQIMLGLLYYKISNYEMALEYINSVSNNYTKNDKRIDIIENANLISILLAYEKLLYEKDSKNETYGYLLSIQSYYDSIRRKPKNEDYILELTITKNILKAVKFNNHKNRIKILHQLRNELLELLKIKNAYNQSIMNNFDLVTWCERCINKFSL